MALHRKKEGLQETKCSDISQDAESDSSVAASSHSKPNKKIRDLGDSEKGSRSRKGLSSGKTKTPKVRRSPSPSQEKMKRKSSRTAAIIANKKKRWEEDDEDSTKDMDDIQTDNNVQIVHNPKPGVLSKGGKDEFTPLKGGTVIDLDEKQAEIKSSSQGVSDQEKQDSTEKEEDEKRNTQDLGDDNLTEQTHHIIVPSYSAWFDYNSIHAIERRALPEFFNGKNKSKTPEVYIAYRNFMLDTYRLNPTEYLTSTAVRRNLAGDVCCILRVHAFLEQWGLLNYQVDPDSQPSAMGPPTTSHFHILADTPSGISNITPAKVSQKSAAQELCEFSESKVTEKDEEVRQELGAVGLKTDIYGKKSHKDKSSSGRSREWTDQETLLLLEALELYKDDWNKVCEHVGSRTQDECILHFLRLPIEDPFLDSGADHLGPLVYQPIPFSKSGNPIMSTVAFLASVVDPRVASAAAKAALDEFSKIKDEIPLSAIDPNIKALVDSSKEAKNTDLNGMLEVNGSGEKDKKLEQDLDKGEEKKGEEPMDDDIIEKDHKSKGKDKNKEKRERKKSKKEENGKDGDSKASEKTERGDTKTDMVEKEIKQAVTEDERLNDASVIATAAAAALASAAVKAKHLAAVEERKIKGLVALLVETQMKKLEIKLKHFEEIEAIMDRERESLECQRQQLLQERQQFHLEQIRAAEYRARQLACQQLAETKPIVNLQGNETNSGVSSTAPTSELSVCVNQNSGYTMQGSPIMPQGPQVEAAQLMNGSPTSPPTTGAVAKPHPAPATSMSSAIVSGQSVSLTSDPIRTPTPDQPVLPQHHAAESIPPSAQYPSLPPPSHQNGPFPPHIPNQPSHTEGFQPHPPLGVMHSEHPHPYHAAPHHYDGYMNQQTPYPPPGAFGGPIVNEGHPPYDSYPGQHYPGQYNHLHGGPPSQDVPVSRPSSACSSDYYLSPQVQTGTITLHKTRPKVQFHQQDPTNNARHRTGTCPSNNPAAGST
ncbi:SWI/SNF complex subunit SMARCC2-like isoform X1 [Biomphalaria glabrata]|uniref:SWI/SNF complex subunit SMARCC2-like isoform X1 n=2 Tax=Biomphalaria glabrata TaxID=6526 RepID=A0A9U8DZD0_BIOGL|nr:SWI/SNF complex subunit SMARCC2-like isoform X1 [Biomphalaria glabrata]